MGVSDKWVGTDKAFNYNFEVLSLFNNEGEGFDIRKIFLGLKLHESITQNFLSGEVSILDATGMIENAKLFGQETLRLRFSSPTIDGRDKPIDLGDMPEDMDLELAKTVKEKYKDCKVIIGGAAIPNNNVDYFKKNPFVDYIIHQEGEISFSKLLLSNIYNKKYIFI